MADFHNLYLLDKKFMSCKFKHEVVNDSQDQVEVIKWSECSSERSEICTSCLSRVGRDTRDPRVSLLSRPTAAADGRVTRIIVNWKVRWIREEAHSGRVNSWVPALPLKMILCRTWTLL